MIVKARLRQFGRIRPEGHEGFSRLRIAAVVGVVAGMLMSASTAFSAFPGHSGSIAFTSNAITCNEGGCQHTLYTINPDGSQLTSLGTYTAAQPGLVPRRHADCVPGIRVLQRRHLRA